MIHCRSCNFTKQACAVPHSDVKCEHCKSRDCKTRDCWHTCFTRLPFWQTYAGKGGGSRQRGPSQTPLHVPFVLAVCRRAEAGNQLCD